MKVLRWLDENFEKTIGVGLIGLMTSIIFAQFIARRVFGNSLVWSEELARYIFIWLIYIGVSYGAKMKMHIRLEMFIGKMPTKAQPYFGIFSELLFLAFAGYIIVYSWDLVQRQIMLGQTSPAIGIPLSIVYAAPTFGFAMASIRQIQVIIERIKEIRTSKSKGSEQEEAEG